MDLGALPVHVRRRHLDASQVGVQSLAGLGEAVQRLERLGPQAMDQQQLGVELPRLVVMLERGRELPLAVQQPTQLRVVRRQLRRLRLLSFPSASGRLLEIAPGSRPVLSLLMDPAPARVHHR